MTCSWCSTEIRESERNCPACGKDLGYPNVRAALAEAEVNALGARYKAAIKEAGDRGCLDLFVAFQTATKSSRAVICRSISKTKDLISNDNELYASFYQLIGAGARRPERTVVERERLLADDLLFPFYKEEMRFAALSLDGFGVVDYGPCSIVLKENAIQDRATVFEENSLSFCKRMGLGFGSPVPPGYRASWRERGLLACIKLGRRMQPGVVEQDFPEILLDRQNFIEVHIYGKLHRGSIDRVVLRRPSSEPDRVILLEAEHIMKGSGVTVEVLK